MKAITLSSPPQLTTKTEKKGSKGWNKEEEDVEKVEAKEREKADEKENLTLEDWKRMESVWSLHQGYGKPWMTWNKKEEG